MGRTYILATKQIVKWHRTTDGFLLLVLNMGRFLKPGEMPSDHKSYFVDRGHVYKPEQIMDLDKIPEREATQEEALEIWGPLAGRPTIWERIVEEKQVKTTLIAAINPQGVIGADGGIPWHRKADMRRFKQRTMGGVLIMGRKTYESLGRKKLKGREIIVLTSNPGPFQDTGVRAVNEIELAFELSRMYFAGRPRWVAGGAMVYEAALPFVDALDLTIVPDLVDLSMGDITPMPRLPMEAFTLESESHNPDDPDLLHRYYVRT